MFVRCCIKKNDFFLSPVFHHETSQKSILQKYVSKPEFREIFFCYFLNFEKSEAKKISYLPVLSGFSSVLPSASKSWMFSTMPMNISKTAFVWRNRFVSCGSRSSNFGPYRLSL